MAPPSRGAAPLPASASYPAPCGPLLAAGLLFLLPLAAAACGERAAEQPTEWRQGEGHRWRELAVRGRGEGFTVMDPRHTGITFSNPLPESLLILNEILAIGSGVAIGDVEGDGLPDLYLAGIERPGVLYRNLGGWRFEDVTERAGVGLEGRRGRGAVFADVDGDRHLDLIVTIHGEPDVLFRNLGDGTFDEVDGALPHAGASTTAALADVDGDGWLDLYVAAFKERRAHDVFSPRERGFDRVVRELEDGGYEVRPAFREHYRVFEDRGVWKRWEFAEPDAFYRNEGGRFERVPFTGGRFLDEEGRPLERAPDEWALAARFHDLTGNGAPDLYVANDLLSPDHIWWNDGRGAFRAAEALAIRTTSATSMAVDFADVDRDGHVDVFTAEMLSRSSARRKTQVHEMQPEPSRPGDIRPRLQANRNALQLSRGDGTFAEMAYYAGLAASEWTWGAAFADVDLDGWEDLLVTTGHVLDFLDADVRERIRAAGAPGSDWRRQRLQFPRLGVPNLAFRNLGGLRFEVEEGWGFGPEADVSHGLALGDLDGDGDLDVVVNRLDAPALVLRNEAGTPRVAVRLVGSRPNTGGVGAVVELEGGGLGVQRKEVTSGGLYLSGSEGLVSFAAGDGEGLALRVRWRGGARSEVSGVGPNRLYEVWEPAAAGAPTGDAGAPSSAPAAREGSTAPREGSAAPGASSIEATAAPAAPAAAVWPHFEDASHLLGGHVHAEALFPEEFRRQPLLPYRLSQLGPGVLWGDVDGDGWEELVVGSGRGGGLAVWRNEGGELVRERGWGAGGSRWDQSGLALVGGGGGEGGLRRLLVGQMSYEASSPEEALAVAGVLGLRGPGGGVEEVVGRGRASVGTVEAVDVTGDGRLEVWVAGRVVPAAYPVGAGARLYVEEEGAGGGWRAWAEPTAALSELGLVSDGAWGDVTGDGRVDLVVAEEWGPVRLFLNRGGGVLEEATEAWGLGELWGRWNGVALGDVTGDGRLDVVATNWGENTEARLWESGGGELRLRRPLRLYYGDFDRNGVLDVVEAGHDLRLGGIVPLRSLGRLAAAMPHVRRRTPTHDAYAEATLSGVLGEGVLSGAGERRAETLSHVLLVNVGGGFQAVRLPREAQYAPSFYAGVADMDGDGREDVFLTQNFFGGAAGTPRYDAGRSLWLRGEGGGELSAVPGRVSGVVVYGDPRGAALGDFDGDGRVDLAVSQNGAETVLYRNVGARRGLRVRLAGPAGNPEGVGAVVRVVYAEGERGPARVVGGSGYWGRNGAVAVLGLAAEPAAVWARWPGGEEVEVPVAPGRWEVTVPAPEGYGGGP